MALKTIETRAVISASDKTGSTFAQVAAKLRQLESLSSSASRRITSTSAAAARAEDSRTTSLIAGGKALMGAVATGAMARGVAASVTSFASLDREMRRIGITADATDEQVSGATKSIKSLAIETALPLNQVTAGLQALVAQGRALPESMSFLPSVAQTAQAAGAEVADIAKTADAAATHLKVASKEMQGAFDIMVQGGNLGSFELKDMAKYLPAIAPAAKAVGIEGTKGLADLVAMLQIIYKGTGSAEGAATAMRNIFQKMNSEETLKRFKKHGVDLEKVMEAARKEGKNLIEVFEDATWTALKGDLSKLPQLINDMEFGNGMRAILSMRGAWQSMSDQMQRTASGRTMRDLSKVTGDTQAKIDRMTQSWDNFKTSLGGAVSIPVVFALDKLRELVDDTNELFTDPASYWKKAEERRRKNQQAMNYGDPVLRGSDARPGSQEAAELYRKKAIEDARALVGREDESSLRRTVDEKQRLVDEPWRDPFNRGRNASDAIAARRRLADLERARRILGSEDARAAAQRALDDFNAAGPGRIAALGINGIPPMGTPMPVLGRGAFPMSVGGKTGWGTRGRSPWSQVDPIVAHGVRAGESIIGSPEWKVSLDPASKAEVNVTVKVDASSQLINAFAESKRVTSAGSINATVGTVGKTGVGSQGD